MEEIHGIGTLSLAAVDILIGAVGVLMHSFIAMVNIIDWLEGKVLSSTDHILTILGVSRIIFQCSAICYIMLTFYFPGTVIKTSLLFVIDLLEVFFTNLSFWLTTLLSVVFCLKICNLKSGLFLLLKSLILPKVLHLIVVAVLFTVCYTALCIWFVNCELPRQLEDTTIINGTSRSSWKYISIFVVGTSAPFFIYLLAAVLLVASMYLHINRMRGHSHGTPRFETFHTAIQFMTVCSLYYIVHSVGTQAAFYIYYFQWLEFLWLNTITDILPVLHSIYLIFKISKLKHHMGGIVYWGTSYFSIISCCQPQSTNLVETIAQ